jgi:hypothetical protein
MSTDTRSSSPALTDKIGAVIHGDGSDTVLLAGHFAIYTAGGKATDFLDDDPARLSKHTDMVNFARATWLAGCDAIASSNATQAKLLVLVDDLQFVQPALPDRGARERLGAALSADYLRRTPTLPGFHARELDARGLDESRVVKSEQSRWIFSERAMRHAAVDRIRQKAATDGRGRLISNQDGSRIIVRDLDSGTAEHTIVHSGHTSCAGGYLELVMRLHERGVKRLVAMVPARCLGPVTLGSALARNVFGAGIEVVNLTVRSEVAESSTA